MRFDRHDADPTVNRASEVGGDLDPVAGGFSIVRGDEDVPLGRGESHGWKQLGLFHMKRT